jgi:hypothetical protein
MQTKRSGTSDATAWLLGLCICGLPSCAEIFGVKEARCSKEGCPDVVAAPPTNKPTASAAPEAGIPDAQGVGDAEAGAPDAAGEPKDKDELCAEYCQVVTNSCGINLSQYKSKTECAAVCKDILQSGGEPDAAGTNTIECRIAEAEVAFDAIGTEFEEACVSAGLMGTRCGGDCENYCSFMKSFCPEDYKNELGAAACLSSCSDIPRSKEPYSGDTNSDHLECRTAHLQLAAEAFENDDLEMRAMHCGHAAGKPGPCASKETLCQAYCSAVTDEAGCGSELKQYRSNDGCQALCMELLTASYDTKGDDRNTIECRTAKAERAKNFSEGVPENCAAAGPVGGVPDETAPCGDACKNYCDLMKTHCAAAYEELGDCIETCNGVPRSDAPYTSDGYGGDNLECRFGHIQLATENPNDRLLHCGHAAGGAGPCATTAP